MCGIALKHSGHAVELFEQDGDQRHSYMAGIGLGPVGAEFLNRHDRFSNPFTHVTNGVNILNPDGSVQLFANGRRHITSWDILYFRFRSLFDGYHSTFYPQAPEHSVTDGKVIFHPETKVIAIRTGTQSNSKPVLTVLNLKTQETSHTEADLIIGADGPNSMVRAQYLHTIQRKYSGYIAWRGTVAENEVSLSTRDLCRSSVVAYTAKGQHCIMYSIPGIDGSLEAGERLLNFLWYTNESLEALDEIMIDGIDKHRHHNIVPSGHVREDIWLARLKIAKSTPLPQPFFEVINKIHHPFVQIIDDFYSRYASFENGRILLAGDALLLFRPHTVMGGAQGAYHALAVEDYANGKISIQDWESKVLRFSFTCWLQSIWWGNFYQRTFAIALVSGLRYWIHCGFSKLRAWWYQGQ